MQILIRILGWNYLKLKKIPYERRRGSLIRYILINIYYKFLSVSNIKTPKTLNKQNLHVYFRPTDGNWVLSKISNAVSNGLQTTEDITVTNLEKYRGGYVFYEHYLPYAFDLARGYINKKKAIIWFTHLRQHSCSPLDIVRALNQSALVVFQCKADADTLKKLGFTGRHTILNGGVDLKWSTLELSESQHCKYDILISSKYYERKKSYGV